MIKRFLQKVFNKRTKADVAINNAELSDTSAAKIIAAKQHKINKSLIILYIVLVENILS